MGVREELPLLLALSANSPFWQGRDTGLASVRTPLFSMFPRVGIPRRFETYAAYVGAVDVLVGSGAIVDPGYVWWDARLQPRLGTLEVRIMDAQSRVAESAALAALVQCLVKLHADGEPAGAPLSPEALDENRFLAARDGMTARLIDCRETGLEPAAHRLARVLAACRPIAAELGCERELAAISSLVAMPGHARQRAVARRHGLVAATASLALGWQRSVVAAQTLRRSSMGPRHDGDARLPIEHARTSLPVDSAAQTLVTSNRRGLAE
jgi:glutamate---cysteine ligase / carboxylate-amine ligase